MRNSSTVKGVYAGNGVTKRWSIPFEYLNTSEICAMITTTVSGVDTETEISSSDYQIDTVQNEVVYPKDNDTPAIGADKKITIYRSTDTLQTADYTNQGAAWPDAIESSLDKLHQIVQEQNEVLGRTFQTNKSSNVSPKEYAEALINASDAAVTAAANAAVSETNAGNSATAAYNSQVAAASSETNAGLSATAAGNSATAAHNSELAAASSETNAGNSATAAGNSATAAYNSQVAAAASETNAGNSATAAHNSELAAAASETNAGNSETAAAGSATSASNTAAMINAHAGYRQPSTEYAAGDMATDVGLPYGLYLECKVGGTTDSGDITLPSPVVENATVTDGTVTWTIRSITQYAQELAGKADRQLSNLDTANLACHVVVDSYYDSTTGDWYRVYDDGWVEQGGATTATSTYGSKTVNFLKPFASSNYSVSVARQSMADSVYTSTTNITGRDSAINFGGVSSKTTTSCAVASYAAQTWMAVGMGAST